MKHLVVILGLCVLTGCANIPLATMVKFRNFDQNTLFQLAPEGIRTQVMLNDPVKLKVADTLITIGVETNHGERVFRFPLMLLNTTQTTAEQGLFVSTPARTIYTLALAPEALDSFHQIQSKLPEPDTNGNVSISVAAGFEPLPENLSEIGMSILLQLSPQDAYVTLIDDAVLPITRSD